MKIGFIGVGKLGQSCAEVLAEKYDVIGYDVQPRSPANFTMVNALDDACVGRDLIFVAVPTPHDPMYDGNAPTSHLPPKDFDYSAVKSVLQRIDSVVAPGTPVVLISTVLPGTIRAELAPHVRNAECIYNPYLIAMGTVKWDMVHPEMIMLGTRDGEETAATQALRNLYRTIVDNSPREILGTWEEIESIKVFYNTFISMKIGLVNMVQDVAERLGHMNAEAVCDALAGSTRRIMGPAYMTPGMGDGGACHPRDNIALRHLADRLDLGYDLFDAVMRSRESQARNMAVFLAQFGLPVVIVGKAYKPLVEYEHGSSSMLVGHYLQELNIEQYYYDEIVCEFPPPTLGRSVYLLAHSPEVTYGNQLRQVEEFVTAKSQDGPAFDGEHSSVVVNTGNKRPIEFVPGSVVVDPWRRVPPMPHVQVIHYGDTRSRRLEG